MLLQPFVELAECIFKRVRVSYIINNVDNSIRLCE
jgi:hypothetical protein